MKLKRIHLLCAAAATCLIANHANAAFCQADLDSDGTVGAADLALLLGAWGPNPGDPADFNGSGSVGAEDLAQLLGAWSKFCGDVDAIISTQLVGNSLSQYPFFEYVLAFNEGAGFEVAIDPGQHPEIVGKTCDIYVVAARTAAQWGVDGSLTDITGGAQTETFGGVTIQANTFSISGSAALSGDVGADLGNPFDVVCDCNQNGTLDEGDFIDGLNGEEGGLPVHGGYVVHDTQSDGPFGVIELSTYSVGTVFGIVPTRVNENTFYPSNIASLGEVPLIVVSHGNGHQYVWYDHIGEHMASYGYVVMSHNNNTGPGIETASQTTLGHTDAFLSQLGSIGGGVMNGHVDSDNIVWIGHSRGGEGVARSVDRIVDGSYNPSFYSLDSLQVVSSIAPTDFLGPNSTDPHDVNYHLWTGGSDADVNGCASCNLCQTFHLHDRADQYRQSVSVHGAGHGDFHDGGGSSVATGPCLIGRPSTHRILKGYFFPLVEHYVHGNVPARDFLTRQYESFRPIGAPVGFACAASGENSIVVDLMYREGDAEGKFVVDDFQTQTSTGTSSSGGSVSFTVANLTENRLDDNNTSFTWTAADPMNGMTVAGPNDTSRGVVFNWSSDRSYETSIIGSQQDLSDDSYISFRACQGTRHPSTTAVLGDLTFTVSLVDGSGETSGINIGAYGGGVEEPYQRPGCGTGAGWANEFETIRIRITDFLNNGSDLDLTDIEAIRFDFGPSWGSTQGRLGLDDIEILN